MTQEPSTQKTDPGAFVKLVTANGLPEADLWKAVLESSGIEVYFRNEAVAAVIPETTGELSAVDLWVPRDQAAAALEILQDERVEPHEEDELT
jgi:Putative prokaryotic signal transducing protein